MGTNILDCSVFGGYEQKENQVTAALLKILQEAEGDLLLNHVLYALEDEGVPSNALVIKTQDAEDDSHSRPDGHISCHCSFDVYIESKLGCEINETQLQKHLDQLKDCSNGKLIYITKHDKRPEELPANVLWTNWKQLMDCLNAFVKDEDSPVLNYLVQQFELLLQKYELYDLGYKNRVIIVGGRVGERDALNHYFYACQNGRYFKEAQYLAFAWDNRIKYLFKIVEKIENADLLKELGEDYFKKYNPAFLENPGPRTLFRLEQVEDFSHEIVNDCQDKNGKRCAFTYNQAYTDYETIIKAKYTSELKKRTK